MSPAQMRWRNCTMRSPFPGASERAPTGLPDQAVEPLLGQRIAVDPATGQPVTIHGVLRAAGREPYETADWLLSLPYRQALDELAKTIAGSAVADPRTAARQALERSGASPFGGA